MATVTLDHVSIAAETVQWCSRNSIDVWDNIIVISTCPLVTTAGTLTLVRKAVPTSRWNMNAYQVRNRYKYLLSKGWVYCIFIKGGKS